MTNKALVKVYLKPSASAGSLDGEMTGSGGASAPAAPPPPSVPKYFFNVGSVDSFERKMEEAQEALGISIGDEVSRPCLL